MEKRLPRLFAALGILVTLLCGAKTFAAIQSVYQASWKAVIPDGSKGYQIGLSPDSAEATPPALPRGVTVVFDTYDPPTKNPFNAERNINDRPQREIAILWNGVEVVRRLSRTELAGSAGQSVSLSFRFVVGGALLSLRVGTVLVYTDYFLPDIAPFDVHFVPASAGAQMSDVKFAGWCAAPRPLPPIRVRAIDTQLIDKDHEDCISTAQFPLETDKIGRVVCVLTLARTPHGFDPWDRIGVVYLVNDSGEKFEILRFMTPYRRGYVWKQDVTDLLPLLTGTKKIRIECTTYSQGWLASVDFTFYPGPAARHPYRVVNLWNTVAVIGQKANSFEKQVPPRTINFDRRADAVAVRLIATGHGEDPNTDNAAEFLSLWRKLWVGNASYQNTLWKDDNYLNPCRPQGGTWKYDRAGWGPGTVVDPWLVDVTDDVRPGSDAVFKYEIQPYENKTPSSGDPARYVIGSQVIFYKNSAATPVR